MWSVVTIAERYQFATITSDTAPITILTYDKKHIIVILQNCVICILNLFA